MPKVSLGKVGQNLSSQPSFSASSSEQGFFSPVLMAARWVAKISFLAVIWPSLPTSDGDTGRASVSGRCHHLTVLGRAVMVSQSRTCTEIHLQMCGTQISVKAGEVSTLRMQHHRRGCFS